MLDVHIARALTSDAGELLTLQRAAYVTEAQLHSDPWLPPLTQTLAELEDELRSCVALKATTGTRIVGSVRARGEGTVLHIGRLTVAPDLQGRGIGSLLLAAAEDAGRDGRAGPGLTTAALFTGHLSAANLAMYTRRGYVEQRREEIPPHTILVHLAKPL